MLQNWKRLWGEVADQSLNAVLKAFFDMCSLLYEAGLRPVSETFVRNHVGQFFSYLTNPGLGLCVVDNTPRLLADNMTVCAMGHVKFL